MADHSPDQKHTSGKGNGIIIVIAGVVIVALIIVIIILLRKKPETEEEPRRNVVVNQSNAEEIVEDLFDEPYIPVGYYSTSMTTTWHFETGDAISEDAYVANLAENTNDIYFDVFLAEDESEPILASPVIPRGSELENIALDKPLEAGTHDCVMVYHLVDEEQNTISTLRVGFTIIVDK